MKSKLSAAKRAQWRTYGKSGAVVYTSLFDLDTDHLQAIYNNQRQIDFVFQNGYSYRALIKAVLDFRNSFKMKPNTRPKLVNGKIVMVEREPVPAPKPKVETHPYEGKVLLVYNIKCELYNEIAVAKVADCGKCWRSRYANYPVSNYRVVEILRDINSDETLKA